MPLPGNDNERPRTVRDAMDSAMGEVRNSRRSNRRNVLMILAIVGIVVVARQMGFLGEGYQGRPQQTVDLAVLDAGLAALPFVPVLDSDGQEGVRVVEFFDYRCGHCRAMAPIVHDAMAEGEHPFILVPIELPILGPESVLAAQYATAAALQGGYGPYHRALMFSTVPYTDEGLTDLGAALGLDPVRLAEDAHGEKVSAILNANRALASDIGVDGTPSFVIGDLLIVGGMDEASFVGLIAAADDPQN